LFLFVYLNLGFLIACVKLHSGSFRDLLERELLNVVHESYISVACIGFDFAFLLASNFVMFSVADRLSDGGGGHKTQATNHTSQ
jgi:hypothetical protein